MYLSDGHRDTKHFVPGSAWEDYVLGPYDDTATITDEETDTHVRELATMLFHPVNTTSMTKARAPWGVIDPDLKLQVDRSNVKLDLGYYFTNHILTSLRREYSGTLLAREDESLACYLLV
ncbi:hypothetical protein CPC08DRAFT_721684 [Agrocybe pediades]|nr:hypothetical protein CPC08DRAFT_721684 [Agrocybe pediades]